MVVTSADVERQEEEMLSTAFTFPSEENQREDSLLNSAQLTKSSKFSVRDQNPIRNQLCLVSVASIAWECSSKYIILGRKH